MVWNIEAGRALRGPQLAEAERRRAILHRRLGAWFAEHDFLVTTVAQVAPFDVDQPYVSEIAGQTLPTYLDWMKVVLPRQRDRPPRHLGTLRVHADRPPGGAAESSAAPTTISAYCRVAHAFEQATDCRRRRPPVLSTV